MTRDTEGTGKTKLSTNSSIAEEDQSTQESMEDIAMGEIHLPGEEGFDTGLLSTQKQTRLIEPRINIDMNYDSDNDNIDTSNKSTTSKNELGDDCIDISGDITEKSDKEDSVVFNRNTTEIEHQQNTPTKTASRKKV